MAPLQLEFKNFFTQPMGLNSPCSIKHQIDHIPCASLSNAPSFSLARKPSIGLDSSKKHVVAKGQTRHKNLWVAKGNETSNRGNHGIQIKSSTVAMDVSSSSNSSRSSATQVGAKPLSATFGQSVDIVFNNKKTVEYWLSMEGPVAKHLKGPTVEYFVVDKQPFSCFKIHATFYGGIISTAHCSPLLMGKLVKSSDVS